MLEDYFSGDPLIFMQVPEQVDSCRIATEIHLVNPVLLHALNGLQELPCEVCEEKLINIRVRLDVNYSTRGVWIVRPFNSRLFNDASSMIVVKAVPLCNNGRITNAQGVGRHVPAYR